MTNENNNPVITQDLGIVSKQLAPIVSIQQLQNILNTIGQNLKNGSVDNPMISFEGDNTTGFYYDANEGTLYGVSHGVKIFSFNKTGFNIYQPFVNTYAELEVTGTNASNANIIDAGVTELTASSTGTAIILGDHLQSGSLVYIRNLSGQTISLYPTAGDSFYGLNVNQPVSLLPTQFISIGCTSNESTNGKTYYGNVFAGLAQNGNAIFQNIVTQISTETSGDFTISDGGSLIMEKANLKNEEGYIGVSSVANLSVTTASRTTTQYQFNIIKDAEVNGLVQLPNMEEVLNGAPIIIKNITPNNVLVYPPQGQEIAQMGINTPLNLAGNCGGMFTYINGYWAHTILLDSQPNGNILLPGSNAYSTYTQQAAVISYGSNQTNQTGTINITDQIVYLDNQYLNVNISQGQGHSILDSTDGEENVTYFQNSLMLPADIPIGAFVIIVPNYNWYDQNNNISNFSLSCDPESTFIISKGLSGPGGTQQITLSPNFSYLCIKTVNQWNTPIWIVCPLGIYTDLERYVFGTFSQTNNSIIFNTTLTVNGDISGNCGLSLNNNITAQALTLSSNILNVNIGNTQISSTGVILDSNFFVRITTVVPGSNAVTLSTLQGGEGTLPFVILSNETSDEVLLFPSSGGTINGQPVNESYTLGPLESVIIMGYTDANDNLHLRIISLGLSDNVRTTSQFITPLSNNTGILVSGNLNVTNGNITAPNLLSNDNVQVGGFLVNSSQYGIKATGTNQATATTLTSMVNIITQTSDSYCVKPQTNLTSGTSIEIYNRSNQIIKIYPADGEQIELFNQNDFCLLATNTAVRMTIIEENGRRMWVTTMLGAAITQT